MPTICTALDRGSAKSAWLRKTNENDVQRFIVLVSNSAANNILGHVPGYIHPYIFKVYT